jgi:hypothetical protein
VRCRATRTAIANLQIRRTWELCTRALYCCCSWADDGEDWEEDGDGAKETERDEADVTEEEDEKEVKEDIVEEETREPEARAEAEAGTGADGDAETGEEDDDDEEDDENEDNAEGDDRGDTPFTCVLDLDPVDDEW